MSYRSAPCIIPSSSRDDHLINRVDVRSRVERYKQRACLLGCERFVDSVEIA